MQPRTIRLSDEMLEFYRSAPHDIQTWPQGALTIHGFSAGVFEDVNRHWKGHPDRRVTWDWWDWHRAFQKEPERFEVAVYREGSLTGLILGRLALNPPGNQRPRIEVWYLEARPGNHPMKGAMLDFLLELAYYYGVGRGVEELRVVAPLPELFAAYKGLRFELVFDGETCVYCTRSF